MIELSALVEGPDPWLWHPHPSVWLVMGALLAGYAIAVANWGPQYNSPGDPLVDKKQWRLFALGVMVMWVGAEWPIHELSERYLFSVHMVQHFLFSLVAPPLLLLGIPNWMARRLISPRYVMAAMKHLTRPIPAMLAFNAYLVVGHTPAFIDVTLRSELLHFVAHAVLVGLALLMWWPVFGPLPELPRLGNPTRMLYLFGQTIIPTVPGSFLTFAETPLYSIYEKAPRVFPALSAVGDQRLAGIVMKVGGATLLWAIIAVLFFRWSSHEETGVPDDVDWQEMERELNRFGSRP